MTSYYYPKEHFPPSKQAKSFQKLFEDATVSTTTECWEASLKSMEEEITMYQVTFRRSLIEIALASEAFAATFDKTGGLNANRASRDSEDLLADDERNAKFLYRLTTIFSCKGCGGLAGYPFPAYHTACRNNNGIPTPSKFAFSDSAMVCASAICDRLSLDVSLTKQDCPRGFRCLCCVVGFRDSTMSWLGLVSLALFMSEPPKRNCLKFSI
jgi:hypothetical protein